MAEKRTSKAAAARAEKKNENEVKTIEWQGLTLTLPEKLPEEIFLDLALVQSSENPGSTFEMLVTMIGEEQFRAVRHKLKTDKKVDLQDVVALSGQIFEVYGTSEGESEASQDS
jgi:hypothetical protein